MPTTKEGGLRGRRSGYGDRRSISCNFRRQRCAQWRGWWVPKQQLSSVALIYLPRSGRRLGTSMAILPQERFIHFHKKERGRFSLLLLVREWCALPCVVPADRGCLLVKLEQEELPESIRLRTLIYAARHWPSWHHGPRQRRELYRGSKEKAMSDCLRQKRAMAKSACSDRTASSDWPLLYQVLVTRARARATSIYLMQLLRPCATASSLHAGQAALNCCALRKTPAGHLRPAAGAQARLLELNISAWRLDFCCSIMVHSLAAAHRGKASGARRGRLLALEQQTSPVQKPAAPRAPVRTE